MAKALGDGVFLKDDEEKENENGHHGANEGTQGTQNRQNKGFDVTWRSEHFEPARVGKDHLQPVKIRRGVMLSLLLELLGDGRDLINERSQLLVKKNGDDVHRHDKREDDGSVGDTTVAYFGVDVLFRRFDEEEEKDGDRQRHQNRLQIDQSEVDDHANDGHAGRSGSF